MDNNFMKSAFDPFGDLEYTTDHQRIRSWVTSHHGRPARVLGHPSSLYIRFPSHPKNDDSVETISWDDVFDRFEADQLAMQYVSDPSAGQASPPVTFVNRATVQSDDNSLEPERIFGESEGDAERRGEPNWNDSGPAGPEIEEGGTAWTPDSQARPFY
jgi:hypothetical protein